LSARASPSAARQQSRGPEQQLPQQQGPATPPPRDEHFAQLQLLLLNMKRGQAQEPGQQLTSWATLAPSHLQDNPFREVQNPGEPLTCFDLTKKMISL